MNSPKKECQNCHREFSVFIRPYSCELCNANKLCSNCARKFVLSYEPNPSYLRLCNKCCDKVSKGNQLRNSSKLSKHKSKNSSVWSFASSFIGRSSKKPSSSSSSSSSYSSKSIKQQSQSIVPSKYTKSPPTQSCTYYCCSTQNKSTNNTFAENTNQLKDRAPLFPENYNMSTPKRREKQKLILQHRRISDDDPQNHPNMDPVNLQNNAESSDEDDSYYRTMHPLNNLKLKPPKSILSAAMNQVALNISINKRESQHYTANLDTTSLCDCFSDILRKRQDQSQSTSDDNEAIMETQSQSEMDENNETNDDKEDTCIQSNVDGNDNHDDDKDHNKYCHCVTIPIKHKKFKLLRLDILFDDKEYIQLMGQNNNNNDDDECESDKNNKYVAINILLHDQQSQIWSGVQMVKIHRFNQYHIIPNISIQCNQTLIKKAVTITGSIAWRITVDQDAINENEKYFNYPYKLCDIAQMISILTQQRFDIIDSFEMVQQQRNGTKNKENPENKKRKSSLDVHRKNQILPKISPKYMVHEKIEEVSDENHEKEAIKLYPAKKQKEPIQHDGGSHRPTKRTDILSHTHSNSLLNPPKADKAQDSRQGSTSSDNALLPTKSCSSKHLGIEVQEMEKSMLEQEIGRIDSMIMGLENILSIINENHTSINNNQFDEMTTSITSSFMFNTNELKDVKLQIAEHLNHKPKDQVNDCSVSPSPLSPTKEHENKIKECNLSIIPNIPTCVSCQRCSRTILLSESM